MLYKNNFLNQVIFRIDFPTPMETKALFSDEIISAILSVFPAKGMDRIIHYNEMELNASGDGEVRAINTRKEGLEQTFFDKTMKNKVILTNNAIIFEYNKYHSFEDMQKAVKVIVEPIWAIQGICVSRIGLRYINLYNANQSTVKVNKKMFSNGVQKLLSSSNVKTEADIKPLRSMILTEYSYGDIRVNYRTGVFNQFYPAPIVKDDYALDIDCFTQSGIDSLEDISRFMLTAHQITQELFEGSISDRMREVMGNER